MAKTTKTIAFAINLGLTLAFTILWMKGIKHQLSLGSGPMWDQYGWVVAQFKAFHRNIFNINSYEILLVYLSVFLFAHFCLKSIGEFLSQYQLLRCAKLTKCLNNIVESTLMFSMILGFTLLPMFIENYQLKNQSGATPNPNQSMESVEKFGSQIFFQIVETFFYGRILFSIGYLVGTVLNLEFLRSYGVGLTFASLVTAFSYAFGFDLWSHF